LIQTILQILLPIANIISLVAFGIDKFSSKRRSYRIPESRLLLIAFFGPFGALTGMLLFRHKTRKIKVLARCPNLYHQHSTGSCHGTSHTSNNIRCLFNSPESTSC